MRVESLVPAHCEEGSIDHFFENGDALNEQMVQRRSGARSLNWGWVLRYVAHANGKSARRRWQCGGVSAGGAAAVR